MNRKWLIRNLVVLINPDIQVPPLEKGARGISSSGYNQIIKTILFVYIVINTLLFKVTKLILLLKYNAEIPLNPPFTKGEAIHLKTIYKTDVTKLRMSPQKSDLCYFIK